LQKIIFFPFRTLRSTVMIATDKFKCCRCGKSVERFYEGRIGSLTCKRPVVLANLMYGRTQTIYPKVDHFGTETEFYEEWIVAMPLDNRLRAAMQIETEETFEKSKNTVFFSNWAEKNQITSFSVERLYAKMIVRMEKEIAETEEKRKIEEEKTREAEEEEKFEESKFLGDFWDENKHLVVRKARTCDSGKKPSLPFVPFAIIPRQEGVQIVRPA